MATDFSSLDKLVEFGMGVSIATQMMNTMNHVIAQTAYPATGYNPGVIKKDDAPAVPEDAQKKYYIVSDERVAGPMSATDVVALVKKGVVTEKTFCWFPGLNAWKLAGDIPEVHKLILLNS